jgi:1-acyl-sn-glycerol-3-phosphate acyltransferase
VIGSLLVILSKLLSGTHGRWLGCEPDTRQRIYYANHTSHLDALVLWAILPPHIRAKTRPVAAREYWSTGKFRQYLADKVFNAILIERQKPMPGNNPIRQMQNGMSPDFSLIIFPEGGRSTSADPLPFKSGLYHLAKSRPDVDLIPVLIENLNRILPKGEILPIPLVAHVTFGLPIHLEDEESKTAFLERARNEIMRLRNI